MRRRTINNLSAALLVIMLWNLFIHLGLRPAHSGLPALSFAPEPAILPVAPAPPARPCGSMSWEESEALVARTLAGPGR